MPSMPPASRARSSRDALEQGVIGHEWVATAHVPDGVEMRLMRQGDEFTIFLEYNELMSTRASASEQALATMTCDRLDRRGRTELLIGGYGMGYTLRAALEVLGPDAVVTVAELVPDIIAWARGPMHALTGDCLDDARVVLVDDDVAVLIDAAREGYDAILLDVDNGPDGLTCWANDYLYEESGLVAAMKALKPRGILAVWSAAPDAAFTERLLQTGFEVEEVAVEEGADDDDAHHLIWFARKPAKVAVSALDPA
jgi:spermidine synthase